MSAKIYEFRRIKKIRPSKRFICPKCGHNVYVEIIKETQSKECGKLKNKREVIGYECQICSTTFDDPKEFSKKE
jgi:transcription elongation factor Elf1